MDLAHLPGLLLLIFGFGFVIFWHELGHFLAAKWAGVKVDQFAVGFGQAALAWRRGIGLRVGSTQDEYRKRVDQYLAGHATTPAHESETAGEWTDAQMRQAGEALKLGETEYRLNWIPLGGYVKMLGQDDMRPGADSNDPRAYNMKPISKRMVIVSAGVVMNIILAVIGFTILFGIGFRAPAPVVGAVLPGSPAQRAGIRVGDTIISIDGKRQSDFTKVVLSVALASDKEAVPVVVKHPDGTEQTLNVQAERRGTDGKSFLALGITSSSELRGPDPSKLEKDDQFDPKLMPAALNTVQPGDTIIAIDGQPVPNPSTDFYLLDRAVQNSFGRPVMLSIKSASGAVRQASVLPELAAPFGETPVSFLGLEPRVCVDVIQPRSAAVGQLKPGDVVVSVRQKATGDTKSNPDYDGVRSLFNDAGQEGNAVVVTVLRNGVECQTDPIVPNTRVGDRILMGIQLGYDMAHPVVAGVVKSSPADAIGIPAESEDGNPSIVTAVDGQPVASWFDVDRLLKAHVTLKGNAPVTLAMRSGERQHSFEIPITSDTAVAINATAYTVPLVLQEQTFVRKTPQPLQAIAWGVGETRDLIAQFYSTLRGMFQGSVPASGAMGPIGIIQAGYKFAYKGNDWLIWFLSMISANLAVVNFLPIPIVDGGLFTFLIIEKLQGRPLSQRTQAVAQVVGLALIVSVFLFVTYHDIMRNF
jgi:regulator of sigma E protease